jgi:hypothetical protein
MSLPGLPCRPPRTRVTQMGRPLPIFRMRQLHGSRWRKQIPLKVNQKAADSTTVSMHDHCATSFETLRMISEGLYRDSRQQPDTPKRLGVLSGASAESRELADHKIALLLVFWIFATGCVLPKGATFVVPPRCQKIDVQSFTRPCVQRADGELLCDGVVVTATCVEVSR